MWFTSCPFVIFDRHWTRVAEPRVKLALMIERQYGQRQIAEGFFTEPIEDWWEPWMKQADEILDDEELINTVYEALRRRHPQSATRGRMGTPAEIVIRLMVLKHVRGWSDDSVACCHIPVPDRRFSILFFLQRRNPNPHSCHIRSRAVILLARYLHARCRQLQLIWVKTVVYPTLH